MEDGLAGTRSDVANGPKRVLDPPLVCNPGRDQVTVADEFSIAWLRILQAGNVLLGNHQHVGGSLRMNVFERVGAVVLEHLIRRHPAFDDVTE